MSDNRQTTVCGGGLDGSHDERNADSSSAHTVNLHLIPRVESSYLVPLGASERRSTSAAEAVAATGRKYDALRPVPAECRASNVNRNTVMSPFFNG
jgi:hypothetical protein